MASNGLCDAATGSHPHIAQVENLATRSGMARYLVRATRCYSRSEMALKGRVSRPHSGLGGADPACPFSKLR